MRRLLSVLMLSLALSAAAVAQEAEAPLNLRATAPDPARVSLTTVANGFFRPVVLAAPQDGTARLFIVEQSGRIWILQDGAILPQPFLNLSDRVSQSVTTGYSELGLLGLAFDPDFAENRTFYVHYNDRSMTSTIAQFTLSDDDNVADRASEQILLTLRQPYANHNGGDIVFGPDGYLYIAFGDGGSQGDPNRTGQNTADWFGSILRIDPDGAGGYTIPETNPHYTDSAYGREVWNYGLRNPWKFSFDRATGDLYIADVGQNQWEEVNFQPADDAGGANYGWADYEASTGYYVGTAPENMVYPFTEYDHSGGRCSITGGYVYRGEALPDLHGAYFFGDFCTGEIWASWRDMDGAWQTQPFVSIGSQLSAFGEDEAGELYAVDYNGDILRFDPAQ